MSRFWTEADMHLPSTSQNVLYPLFIGLVSNSLPDLMS